VGLFMAFDMPTRQSFIVELVGRKDLPSAIALNSSMFNSARAIGPAVAGLLLAEHVSLDVCFFVNAASYLIVIAGILMMRGQGLGDPPVVAEGEKPAQVIDHLKEGLAYAWSNSTARNILLLVGSIGTFAFSFNVLIPTFVRYTLLVHASNAFQVKTFGYLETVRGAGALAAAISVTLFSRPERYKLLLVGGSILSNGMLIFFALARQMEMAYITMALVTYGFILIFASANTVMQMTVPDRLRGRVMAIYTLVFIGTAPAGSLFAGYIAQYIGASHTILLFAVITLVCVVVVAFRPGGLTSETFTDLSARPVKTPLASKAA
jgi:predicted MFS family arabinose efflux permease